MLKLILTIMFVTLIHLDNSHQSPPSIQEGRILSPFTDLNSLQSCSSLGYNFRCMNMMECSAGKGNIMGIMCGGFMICCGINFESFTSTATPTTKALTVGDLSQIFASLFQLSQLQNNPLFTQSPVLSNTMPVLPSSSLQPNSLSNVFFPINNIPTVPFVPQSPVSFSSCVSAVMGEECGVTQIMRAPKIVGGTNAAFGEVPWQCQIIINGDPRCGGALVAKEWVVSAAHCINGVPDSSLVVRIGDYNTREINPLFPRVDRTVIQRIVHPQFNNPKNYANDIVLLRLNQAVTYGVNIKPVCLPPFQSFVGYQGTVTGWGKPKYGARKDEVPATLHKAQVPIMSKDECQSMYNYMHTPEVISDYWVCAGKKEGGVDACQGDSGGPLTSIINGISCLIGIVSWGYGCGFPNLPGVYTNVSMFVPWLQGQISYYSSQNTVSFG